MAKRYGVCCVIAGHVHQLIHADLDGVTYVAAAQRGRASAAERQVRRRLVLRLDGGRSEGPGSHVPGARPGSGDDVVERVGQGGPAGQMTIWMYAECMKTRFIGATEFKAKCLALLDEIEEHGGTITVTKRGRPVATVSAAKKPVWKSPGESLGGKVKIVGDIVNFTTEHLWEALRRDEEAE